MKLNYFYKVISSMFCTLLLCGLLFQILQNSLNSTISYGLGGIVMYCKDS